MLIFAFLFCLFFMFTLAHSRPAALAAGGPHVRCAQQRRQVRAVAARGRRQCGAERVCLQRERRSDPYVACVVFLRDLHRPLKSSPPYFFFAARCRENYMLS